ncbi:Uu.00g067390.m01.CDS01 [Anthostomella pinea]|uniref:Uu.00g067390.m01.CDS01 n=1 Tax=Anthostomella pinea TaxID=933095 RepID=A0AAI8VUY4_9PEZI|nr:Uu.00g067390.m01.CDS01 [Anthostomella pinea]
MSAEIVRKLAKGNEAHVHNHKGNWKFSESLDQKAVMILSCMDPRADPASFWDLEQGPGIIRNAGGRAKDALRSIEVLSTIMSNGKNTVGAVAVVHHTDCGLLNFSDEFIKNKLKERTSDSPDLAGEIDAMEFGGWTDAEASVREDMAIIKNDPLLPKDLEVIGYVHDVFTGKTTEIV